MQDVLPVPVGSSRVVGGEGLCTLRIKGPLLKRLELVRPPDLGRD